MNPLDLFLRDAAEKVYPAAVLHIRRQGKVVFEGAAGWLEPESHDTPAQTDTYFDLASLTKLFTVTAFLRFAVGQEFPIDTPVVRILPEFSGARPIQPYEDPLRLGEYIAVGPAGEQVEADRVTFRHLLTHTGGLPAWRPLYRLPGTQIRQTVLQTFFSYPIGTRVVYSDLGLILLGWAVEKLTGLPLPEAIDRHVLSSLDKPAVQFGPMSPADTAPTEFCHWRGRRVHGEVHDENTWAMGGVAGHAGLFGSAAAVAALGQAWLDSTLGREGLLPQPLAQEATSLQAKDGLIRRGLGWALWSPEPLSFLHPLSENSFGHTGFTGTSLAIDPARELVIACLTNELYHGRDDRGIAGFRVALHEQVAKHV